MRDIRAAPMSFWMFVSFWPLMVVDVLLLLTHGAATRAAFGVVGTALVADGVWFLFDVRNAVEKLAMFLRSGRSPSVLSVVPNGAWRTCGLVICLMGVLVWWEALR